MRLSPHIRKIFLPSHLLVLVTIGFLVAGWIPLSYLWWTVIGWILISGFGIAIGFHRLFAHSAFETWPAVKNILAYLGCLGAQGSPLFWAALHRGVHHPFSDTPKDIHSPVNGYWNAYIGWQFTLRAEQVPFRYAVHLARDPWLKFLHKHYELVFWGTIAIVALIDYRVAMMGLILPSVISIHQENCIDLFCHLRSCGYRNFDIKDNSVNNFILGFFAFGQGWHNNHHKYPNRYDFGSVRWYEIDVCRWMVPLISRRRVGRLVAVDEVGNETSVS